MNNKQPESAAASLNQRDLEINEYTELLTLREEIIALKAENERLTDAEDNFIRYLKDHIRIAMRDQTSPASSVFDPVRARYKQIFYSEVLEYFVSAQQVLERETSE